VKGEKAMSDDNETDRLLKVSADQGNAAAQYKLGMILLSRAYKIGKDYDEGQRYLRLAADRGHADAQYALGVAYQLGYYGFSKDYDEGQRYLRRAARQGHDGAKRMLETGAPRVGWAKWLYMRGWGYK
jgi:hypothetical protein